MEEELLTANELAAKLKIRMPTIRKWTITGAPHIKVGRLCRYKLTEVINWLQQQHREKLEKKKQEA